MRPIIQRLLALLLLAPTTGYSNAFTNGSFEVGPSGNITSLPVGSTTLAGWQVINGGIEAVSSFYWPPADGSYSLDLNGLLSPGGVRQTFDTISETTYLVAFSLAGNYAWGPNYLMRVTAANTTQDFASVATTVWSNRVFTFTAVSNMTTLAFFDITPGGGGSGGGPALDDVRVLLTPTFAEPASWSEDGFAVTLALPTNGTCNIEATTNLALNLAPWEEVTNFVINTTPVDFTDTSATNHPVRFYRLSVTGP